MNRPSARVTTRQVTPRPVSWRSGLASVLAISGYGVRLFVQRGRLMLEDGFANEGLRRRIALSRGTCKLQRIVMLGRSGFVTLDALDWLAELGIALLFVGANGRLTAVYAPGGTEGSKNRLHRVQAAARESPVGVRIARLLIDQKLTGQQSVLQWLADPGRQTLAHDRGRIEAMREASRMLTSLADELENRKTIDEIVEAERKGAEAYWKTLTGLALKWKPRALSRVPQHWLASQPRESFRTGNRNGATDPTNALLNYGYALLEAEVRIACLGSGLHPGLGIFHADRDSRASFVYDLTEPVRPIVDRRVLQFIQTHTFSEGDCWETREGFCRLDPILAVGLTRWLTSLKAAAAQVVRSVIIELNLSQHEVRPARHQHWRPQ